MSTIPPEVPATVSGATARDAPEAEKTTALVREVPQPRRPGWWGMVLFLATDSALFLSMFGSYYYLEFVSSWERSWPPAGDPLPKLLKASILTALLLVSVLPMLLADLGLKKGSRARMLLGGTGVALLGAAFVVLEVFEFTDELKHSWPSKDAYSSIYYTLLGFHLAHIMALTLFMLLLVVATAVGRMDRRHHLMVRVYSMFWYASVVLWSAIYIILYWSVRV